MRGFIAATALVLMFLCGTAAAATAPAVSPIPNLTSGNFANTIKSYRDMPILVQFKAEWCGYCKRMNPYIETLYTENLGKVLVYRVDIDQQPALAKEYKIRTIPMLLLFYKEHVVARGYVKGEDIQAWVDQQSAKAQQPSLWSRIMKKIGG